MIAFFERGWFLWWRLAVVVMVRRSHMFSGDFRLKSLDPFHPWRRRFENERVLEDRMMLGGPACRPAFQPSI
jgi:hypothetical protein